MKWNRLKNRIRSKPELIDPYRVMSYRAAKKTWKIQGRPDTWDFMEGARIKAAKTPSEWEALTGISRKQYVSSANASRRLAIALIVIILMASFMACTVPGRALAKAIYKTFTTFVGNMLYISMEQDTDNTLSVPQIIFSDSTSAKLTIEEAYIQINKPLFYLHGDEYTLKDIVAETKAQGKSLSSYYIRNDINITLKQQWFTEGHPLDADILLDDAQYYETDTRANIHFYGAYTNSDQCYVGSAIVGSSAIYISMNNILDLDNIDQILNDLTYYSQ